MAKWWQALEDKEVQCNLCPHNCIIKNSKKGICQVRINQDGILYSVVYGHPVAVNIDPIEKKPLFHFLPGTNVFSLGTIGCNLGCKFCQNFEIARAKYPSKTGEFLSPKEIVDLAVNNECKSIAFTYNEPTIFGEYIIDIAKIAHQEGLKTVMVTNGYINPGPLKDIYQYIDAANIDLKGGSESFYKDLCEAKLQPVLDAINKIYEMGVFVEITNLIIPGYNDNPDLIDNMLDWLYTNLGAEIPLHFSAFHPAHKMINVSRTSKKSLDKIREKALDRGFYYVYEGNVMTTKYDNTYCPKCQKLLVERQIFTVVENILKSPYCSCGQKINIHL